MKAMQRGEFTKKKPQTWMRAQPQQFFGVGGRGRRPIESADPEGTEGAGVRVNLETKRKFIVDYREAMKLVVKCSLRRARGQGLGGKKRTPGPSVRLHIYNRSCNLARAGLQFTCIFTIDPATWPPSGALGAPWAPCCVRDLDLKVILRVFLCRRGCKVPTLETIIC